MKKLITIIMLLGTAHLFAQTYPITGVNISMPASPGANTASWGQGAFPFSISAQTKLDSNRQVNPFVMESRVLVTIKKGGGKVCGTYTNASAPVSNFNNALKVWNGRNGVSLLGQDCVLPAGEYELCVQFFGNRNGVLAAFSDEKCKSFTIAGTDNISYQPPQNISPADGTVIKEADAKKPITFRWTPVLPRPKEDVLYKVRVVEIKKGQNKTEALKTSSPLLEKEVTNLTQLPGLNINLGGRAIENDSKYAWYVQATGKNGKDYGSGEVTAFSIQSGSNVNVKNDSVFCKNQTGNYTFTFTILNNDSYSRTFNSLSVYSINGIVQGTAPNYLLIPTSQLTPGTGTAITANGSLVINGYINYGGNINAIVFLGQTSGGVPPKNGDFDFTDTLSCGCKTCDSVQLRFPPPTPGQVNNNVTIKQSISTLLSPLAIQLPIKSISTEIIYFEIEKNDTLCYRCEKNSGHFGKFVNATLNATGFIANSSLPGDEVVFASAAAQALAANVFDFEIAAPEINKCCNDTIKVCIRYTIITQDCKTCSVVKCYDLPRTK